MKRSLLMAWVLMAVVGLVSANSSAALTLDQHSETLSTGFSVDSNSWGNQSFTPTMPYLGAVEYNASPGASPANVVLEVRSGLYSDGPLLFSQTFTNFTPIDGWNRVDFPSLIAVDPNTPYNLTIKTTSGSMGIWWSSTIFADPYPGGWSEWTFDNGTSWNHYYGIDRGFRTYGDTVGPTPTPTPTPLPLLVLDQSSEQLDTGFTVDTSNWGNQVFTPTMPYLGAVEYNASPNASPADMVLEVRSGYDSLGGVVLYSQTFTNFKPIDGWNRVDFPSYIPVTPGAYYNITIKTTSGTMGIWWSSTIFAGTYPGGWSNFTFDNGTSWNHYYGMDRAFRTWGRDVVPTPTPTPTPTPPPVPSTMYFGYYEEDDARFGYYAPENYGSTNFTHIPVPSHDFYEYRTAQATAAGQRIFLDFGAFFNANPESTWDSLIASFGNYFVPYKDHIAAVFVIDEPFTSTGVGGFSKAQVEHMISAIKNVLPGVPTVISFMVSSMAHNTCPSNLDWVGTTIYPWWSPNASPLVRNGPTTYADFKTGWNSNVGTLRVWAGGRPLWIYGESAQGVPLALDPSDYPYMVVYPTAGEAQWYKDILAESENRDVIGLSWYTYASEYTGGIQVPGNEYQTGARVAPSDMLGFLRTWGAQLGDEPYLGPVHLEAAKYDKSIPFPGSRTLAPWDYGDYGSLLRNNYWVSFWAINGQAYAVTGGGGYNISAISLCSMGGSPTDMTIKLYKVSANASNTGNLPPNGTLIAQKTFANPVFNADGAFTRFDFDTPVPVQAGLKYIVALSTTDSTGIYLWGTRHSGYSGYLGYSQDQGATWHTGFASPPNSYTDPWGDCQLLHILHTRDDYNPIADVDITIPTPWEDSVISKWRSLQASDWIGQSFSPGATANNITGFAFGGDLTNNFVLNGGKIYGRLYYADSDGLPFGGPLASAEANIDELGGFAKVDFGAPVLLGASTDGYVATLEVDSAVTGSWLACYTPFNPYWNGRAVHRDTTTGLWSWISGPEDWKFRTFYDLNVALGQVTISGTISLGNFAPSPWPTDGLAVTIELRNPGQTSPIEIQVVKIKSDGQYSFTTLRSGAFDLTAKGSHWLRRKAAGVTLGTNPVNFSLINGDCDGDNEVTSTDLSIILTAMDSVTGGPNWDSTADLDGNGTITSADLSISLTNMDQMGNL